MSTPGPAPPVAAVRPHRVESPHGTRIDEYYWLRDDSRSDPSVLAWLHQENAYTDAALAHVRPLTEQLHAEMSARLQPDASTVPYRMGAYRYYARFEAGREYPVHARRALPEGSPEQVLLDVNAMAAGHDFFAVGAMEVSPDGNLLLWAQDTVGRNQFTLHVKDLRTGAVLDTSLANVEPEIAWADDNRTFFYVEKDPETLLGLRVRRRTLGEPPQTPDPLVFEQHDDSFYTGIQRSKDERYLLIHTQSTVSSEVWFARADDPTFRFQCFLPRERDHEYQVDHAGDRWILRTNWRARNFRIVEVAHGSESQRAAWRDLLPHRDDALVDGFDVFRGFLAVEEHSGGLRRIRVRPWSMTGDTLIDSDEPAYSMHLDVNREFDSGTVRYVHTTLTTPRSTWEYEAATGRRTLLKREAVLGGYDPDAYDGEFAWAVARDGTQVPVTLAWRRGTPRDGTAPLLQMGYGAYGIPNDPEFSYALPSLLDRGFLVAVAHVRGGQELGRDWYDQGRLLNKHNTFTDFIDVTRWLVARGDCDPARVFATGRSAGGLLMGAIANMAPGDYRGIVSGVPFVDVVTTMLDQSIPLTTNEYDEWGDPREKTFHDAMLAYSPYDNLRAQDYPAMYVFCGLWDSQVQYFEPAKYVARLRARRTDDRLLVLRTNMDAGHGGSPGRFQRFRERAEEYAFLLDQAGVV